MPGAATRVEQLGYEASLDLGIAALERGLTAAAVPYLEQAVSRRPTRFALVQLGKAHRDAGQLQAARQRLEQARSLPDGKDLFVLVSLAAVLCDLGEHGSAFEVAMEAAKLKPKDPATMAVLARCMKELALVLGDHDHVDPTAVEVVLAQAEEFSQAAQDAKPDSLQDMKERRRMRAAENWEPPPPSSPATTPVSQEPATVLDASFLGELDQVVEVPAAEVQPEPASVWQRVLQRLMLRR